MQISKMPSFAKLAAFLFFGLFLAASGCVLNPFAWMVTNDRRAEPPKTATVAKSDSGNKTARPADRTRCGLRPDPGRCRAAFKRYFFDTRAGKCATFIWGGCGGTVPFENLAECKADCEF